MKASSLARRALRFIEEHRLFPPGETIIVGVSGGPDSVCLLHVLLTLREKLNINLHIAHLNHQLRGQESEEDARYVAQLSHKLHLPSTIEARDVATYRIRHRLSLEQAARDVRYDFFAQVAKAVGASSVAVGHTANDQAETVIMHLIRGTGLTGLAGMKPKAVWQSNRTDDKITIVRPLLETTRKDTEAYCQAYELNPRSDPSNWFPELRRNWVRWELLPLLKKYNSRIEDTLRRTARAVADDLAFIENELSKIWPDVVGEEGESIILNTGVITSLPPALQRHLLLNVFRKLGRVEITATHIEAVMQNMKRGTGKKLSLPGGLVFTTEYGICRLEPKASYPMSPLLGEYPLQVPGETIVPGWRVNASIIGWPSAFAHGWAAHMDYDKASSRLTVRTRRPGDRFQPLGMDQPKKLQDFMVDAKIPEARRDKIPLVVSPEHILWVVGWRIDERVKITPETKQVLFIEFELYNPS